jgi:hypothetical protein
MPLTRSHIANSSHDLDDDEDDSDDFPTGGGDYDYDEFESTSPDSTIMEDNSDEGSPGDEEESAPTVDPTNELIDRRREWFADGHHKFLHCHSHEWESSVNLLHMLKKANAPIHLYSDILKWAKESAKEGVDFEKAKFASRNQFIKTLGIDLDLAGLQPKKKNHHFAEIA